MHDGLDRAFSVDWLIYLRTRLSKKLQGNLIAFTSASFAEMQCIHLISRFIDNDATAMLSEISSYIMRVTNRPDGSGDS